MQRLESLKEEYSSQLSSSQYSQLAKNVFMFCPHHKYEQICYVNISQNTNHPAGQDDSYELKDYDDESQSSEEEQQNIDIKELLPKDKDEEIHSDGSNPSLWNRFLCAECVLEIDIDKNNLIPLRKLVFNQNKLYNNWPPLESGLNKKIYEILKIQKDKNECMVEIDRTCSSLIEQFTQLVSQLKKDLLRIEGERFSILTDLQELYENISNIDAFSGLLNQSASQSTSSQSQMQTSQLQQNSQLLQLQQPSSQSQVQQQTQQQQQPASGANRDAYLFDFDQLSTNNQNRCDLSMNGTQQLQQLIQQQPLGSVIHSSSQNASSSSSAQQQQMNLFDDVPSQISRKEEATQAVKNGKQGDCIRRKIEDFIEDKYTEKKNNSSELTKLVQQLNKFKPLEENLQNLKEFGNKMKNKLSSFSNQIKYKLNLTDFQMQKSLFKNSSLLLVDRNYKNQITIHTDGQIWGQVYSDFVLDNHSTYQFIFQFKHEVQNFIIIGLIPDAYKDQISQGSSQNHFGKIFGQENITYCGSIVKGNSQLSFLRKNDAIMMEVCVAKNHLTFSDHPNQQNITKLHSDYTLNTNGKYRMCIEFYDFDEENTITILDAKSF